MYIVLELQTYVNGQVGTLVSAFNDLKEAESKYHQILAYAAIGNLPSHSAVMLREDGFQLKYECYTHEQPEPEPEPEPGPEVVEPVVEEVVEEPEPVEGEVAEEAEQTEEPAEEEPEEESEEELSETDPLEGGEE